MSPRIDKSALDGAGLFANLDAAAKAEIVGELEHHAIPRGEALMRQGEPGDALYIVVSGRFGVTRGNRRTLISEIGPGQPIGEIGFLTGAPRTATVTALRDSLVLKLERADFDALALRHPSIWPAITATTAACSPSGMSSISTELKCCLPVMTTTMSAKFPATQLARLTLHEGCASSWWELEARGCGA